MKYFIVLIIGEIIGYLVYVNICMPHEIECRMKDLNLMQYDGKTDKFIPKDSVKLNSEELNYLIKGTTKTN